MISLADFQLLKTNLFSSKTGVKQKDISMTKFMLSDLRGPGINYIAWWRQFKIFTSAFKFRAKYCHINL